MKIIGIGASKKETNVRKKMILMIMISAALILTALVLSFTLSNQNLRSNGSSINLSPSLRHLFGTDWLGRDMFTRTVKGLRLSLAVGTFAGLISAALAAVLGICAGVFGKTVDAVISWFIDLFIGMPHIVFMILISFILGGGVRGIVIGVSVTHWTGLARIIRAEVLQLKNAEYIQIAKSYGKSIWFIGVKHILPGIFPQILIGFLLLFPHLILHEAAITFLGFGFSPQTPAIGVILSEAMEHISTGKWRLALFPGLVLVIVIKSFDNIGEQLRILMEPAISNE
jgi:peptide/nickel transport system permease protein